jgi:hypothetical protein
MLKTELEPGKLYHCRNMAIYHYQFVATSNPTDFFIFTVAKYEIRKKDIRYTILHNGNLIKEFYFSPAAFKFVAEVE